MKVALLQIAPKGSIEENREKGLECCRKAKALSADIALFPEMWSIGYSIKRPPKEWTSEALPSDSSFIKAYKDLAAELNMAIGVTFLEKTGTGVRNSFILFDMHGEERLHYSKVHTCDFGNERYLTPGDGFSVSEIETAEGKVCIGVMICYDREFPESARILMLEGAELILVPNACPMEINRLSQLRSRAFENMTAIATCNYPASVPDCNGHSTLFDGIAYLPDQKGSRDTCILEADGSEGIFIADLNLGLLRKYRQREVHGNAYRHPEKYHKLIDSEIREPFIREDRRQDITPYPDL